MMTAPRSTALAALAAIAALFLVTTCRDDQGTQPHTQTTAPSAASVSKIGRAHV